MELLTKLTVKKQSLYIANVETKKLRGFVKHNSLHLHPPSQGTPLCRCQGKGKQLVFTVRRIGYYSPMWMQEEKSSIIVL